MNEISATYNAICAKVNVKISTRIRTPVDDFYFREYLSHLNMQNQVSVIIFIVLLSQQSIDWDFFLFILCVKYFLEIRMRLPNNNRSFFYDIKALLKDKTHERIYSLE